jgi:tetratricopeptide (TPR) repeat protein
LIRIAALVLLALVAAVAVLSVKIVGDDQVALVGEGDSTRELRSGINLVRPFTPIRRYHLAPRYFLEGKSALVIPLGRGKVATVDCVVEARVARDRVRALDRDYEGGILERLVVPLVSRDLGVALRRVGDPAEAPLDSIGAGLGAKLNESLASQGITTTAVVLKRLVVSSVLPKDLARQDGFKVFILGLDAYDWVLSDLVSKSRSLPNIERLRREGSWGNLRSIEPLVSPLLWTTMATGVTPDIHGITDFLGKNQDTGEDIPATSDMRRVAALWNIASLFGVRPGFVGWLATYPAEEVEGFIVSDRVAYHMFDPAWATGETTVPTEGLTWPPRLLDEIRPLLVEPAAVGKEISTYIHGPVGALKTKFDPLDPVSNLRLIISGYQTYRGIMEQLYPEERPDLAGVYFEFTDSACHLFMRYMAPPMPGVTAAEADRFGDGVAASYAEADRILGEVLGLVDDRTVLVVVSDHGFKSGDTRPMSDSRIGIGQATDWHRLNGAIALYGPGIKRGHQIADASVLDVAPTVLHLLGLPVGSRMTGKVLTEALEPAWVGAHPVRRTAAYDSLAVASGKVAGASEADQALKEKLQSLGYVAGGNASLVNMANFYHKNGRYAEAIEVWKKLIELDPKDYGARIGLANAHFEVGQADSAIAGLKAVIAADPRNMQALQSLATVYVRKGMGNDALRVAEEALRVDPANGGSHFNRGLALEVLGRRDEAVEEYRQAVHLAPDLAEPYANLAQAYLDKGMLTSALEAARKAADLAPEKPEVHYVLGQALEFSGKPDEALLQYMASLRLDSRFTAAAIGASGVLLAQGKTDSALAVCDAALRTSTQYGEYLHTIKGTAYLGRRDLARARAEFETSLKADRNFLPARLGLARVYIAQGKTGDARRELEAVLAAQPSNQEARSLLGTLR